VGVRCVPAITGLLTPRTSARRRNARSVPAVQSVLLFDDCARFALLKVHFFFRLPHFYVSAAPLLRPPVRPPARAWYQLNRAHHPPAVDAVLPCSIQEMRPSVLLILVACICGFASAVNGQYYTFTTYAGSSNGFAVLLTLCCALAVPVLGQQTPMRTDPGTFTCADYNDPVTCAALGDLYYATSGAGWIENTGWSSAAAGIATDYCGFWTGYNCGGEQCSGGVMQCLYVRAGWALAHLTHRTACAYTQ